MNDLIKTGQEETLESREVAKMVDKIHAHLMRDIAGYCSILTLHSETNFGLADFFIESTYLDAQDKPRPHYLITRKGCDFIANKLTGEKGIKFTAEYVTRFHQMEAKQFPTVEDMMIAQLQNMKAVRLKLEAQDKAIESIKEVFTASHDEAWRQSLNKLFNSAVENSPEKDFQELRRESYSRLEQRTGVNLTVRLNNLLKRKKADGATTTALGKTNKLDVIEADKMLKEIYTTIVKELAIGYGVTA